MVSPYLITTFKTQKSKALKIGKRSKSANAQNQQALKISKRSKSAKAQNQPKVPDPTDQTLVRVDIRYIWFIGKESNPGARRQQRRIAARARQPHRESATAREEATNHLDAGNVDHQHRRPLRIHCRRTLSGRKATRKKEQSSERCSRSWVCSKKPAETHDLCRRCSLNRAEVYLRGASTRKSTQTNDHTSADKERLGIAQVDVREELPITSALKADR